LNKELFNNVKGRKMRFRTSLQLLILLVAAIHPILIQEADSDPSTISGDVNIENDWPIAPIGSEETILEVKGSFILTEKTGFDLISPVTATVSVTSGKWNAVPRVSTYEDVAANQWISFIIDVSIPPDARAGENSPYTVTVRFEGQVSEDEVSKGFVVNILNAGGNDNPSNDPVGNQTMDQRGEDSKGFPIWPVFLLGLIAIAVVGSIWAYRNVEMVRETDGKRRIYLREKDTGRIFGKDR